MSKKIFILEIADTLISTFPGRNESACWFPRQSKSEAGTYPEDHGKVCARMTVGDSPTSGSTIVIPSLRRY